MVDFDHYCDLNDAQEPSDEASPAATQLSDSYLVGFVIVNIVGLRYYTGTINGREMVGFVREPLNRYDPNAIKVLNTRSVQVGHIDRTSAAVLAPLIDSRIITVEGIVPKPPSKQNRFSLPCQVHVFARMEAFAVVRAEFLDAGLMLIERNTHEFGVSEAVVVKEERGKRKRDEKSVDEIFALVDGNGGNFSMVEPPKDVIVTELFPHQKEGLGWLIGRENDDDLPPFWEKKDGDFINVLTNHLTKSRPQPLKGGIFADDMGLGKTLTLLSLIATSKLSSVDHLYGREEENSSQGAGVGKKPVISRGTNKRRKKSEGSWSSVNVNIPQPKTTLVVCPPSVFATWITQLEEHTSPGSLKVYLYHGERTRDVSELLKYDIVLTTYSILSTEGTSDQSPIMMIEWFRVILDEAHLIKSSAAQQTKACIALKAERRWVVTGTPIQNNSLDLFSLMAFLRFEPFSIKSYWQSLVQRPLDRGCTTGMSRLQVLIRTISLRRTKDLQFNTKSLVGLPPKSVETCFVDLSAEERNRYDRFESEARSTIQDYIDSDTAMRKYSTVLLIILRLRQICNHVALIPGDLKSVFPSDTLEDASNNPELLKKLVATFQVGDDFDCPICLCPPAKTVITSCAHVFCQTCIMRSFKQTASRCPICRRPLSKENLFLAPPSEFTSDEDTLATSSDKSISSKVSTLLKLLLAVQEHNPSTKSIIFSQFRKMLLLLEDPLRAAGFSVIRLDGSMTTKKRTEVIKEFSSTSPNSPSILLASLKAAGTGINLTAASRVYLMEPWWNPAVEEQAMDRVHRIGQRNKVMAVRLIVRGTIEEKILELQERKKKLASGAFGRRSSKEEDKQSRVEDLRTIMRL